MSFDYGKKRADGQYENHPTYNVGDYVAPIRDSYKHNTCGSVTFFGMAIAETYAKNPSFYGRTFCSKCGDYFPVSEFKWAVDGIQLGQLGGIPGQYLTKPSTENNLIRSEDEFKRKDKGSKALSNIRRKTIEEKIVIGSISSMGIGSQISSEWVIEMITYFVMDESEITLICDCVHVEDWFE